MVAQRQQRLREQAPGSRQAPPGAGDGMLNLLRGTHRPIVPPAGDRAAQLVSIRHNAAMTRNRWRLFLWLATCVFFLLLVWQARSTLIPFGVGAIIAYSLEPVVGMLARLVEPRVSARYQRVVRGFAVGVIYLVFFGSLIAAGFYLVPVAAEQVNHFVDRLPALVKEAREQADEWVRLYRENVSPGVQEQLNALADDAASAAAGAGQAAARRTVSILTSTASTIFGFAVVPFWMFYVMRDRPTAVPALLAAVPPEIRQDARHLLRLADHLLGRYIRGQLFLGLIVGVAVGVAMTVLGVDLSIGLGVWAGVTELIPIIGPWLGAIPGLIIVAATAPHLLIPAALVYLAVQQLENNLLVPHVQSGAVDLHPAVIFVLLTLGGAVAGFTGLVVVIPLAAILREVFWYLDRRLLGQTPDEALAASRTEQVRLARETAVARPRRRWLPTRTEKAEK
ncbi:MAG: AI-2E family transporter [Dehalococcoidia bacterium]|nr:MAG: AI-2E family transporter [Dehalococcoidia bacterium]